MKRISFILSGLSLLVLGAVLGIRLGTNSEGNRPQDQAARPTEGVSSREPVTPYLIRMLSDPSLHTEEQISAVRELPTDLSQEERASLLALLRQPCPSDVTPGRWYTLLNEVMEVLRHPRFTMQSYGAEIAALMTDRHVDPVVRDYAAQHLSLWLSAEGSSLPENAFASGMDAFLTILHGEREAFEPVFGTSLMALCDLQGKSGEENFSPFQEALGQAITPLLSFQAQASLSNRISAIQAAGRLGLAEARPLIRELAGENSPHSSIRLSSVAALGYFADPQDHAFLQDLAQSDDKLRFAAQEALKNFL